MKKFRTLILSLALPCVLLAGCGASPADDAATPSDAPADITVISREDGSGTRGAFIELFGIQEKDADGKKVDHTMDTADITQSTGVMLTSVAGNEAAIGYISLGSLNESVKALQIDGAEATVENVKNGSYKISRPFNVATKGTLSPVAEDFLAFVLSSDGQGVVEKNGYIAASAGKPFTGSKPEGKVTVAGSSSVSPVMEKLKEAYEALNPSATIEINQSDSTTGMNSVAEAVCDIGMASRELSESELAAGLFPQVIAIDGIAVIVNNSNPVSALTAAQVKDIYTGAVTSFEGLSK